MTRWPLKYGLNPHQGNAAVEFPDGAPWLEVINGQVGYINLLDAIKAWALARELATTLGLPAATSIKHVHPAGRCRRSCRFGRRVSHGKPACGR